MASILKVDKLDPQSGTALEIGTSGDTITVPSGATLDISSATLTPPATLPASSGVNLTALNASNLGSGTVPTARLGSGTASSSVFLAGDNTWAAAGGGKILQVVFAQGDGTETGSTTTSYADTSLTADITPSATSSTILCLVQEYVDLSSDTRMSYKLLRDSTGVKVMQSFIHDSGSGQFTPTMMIVDSPSSTSALTYKTQFARFTGSGNCRVQQNNNANAIMLLEIDGS